MKIDPGPTYNYNVLMIRSFNRIENAYMDILLLESDNYLSIYINIYIYLINAFA